MYRLSQLLNWAWQAECRTSSAKLVLLCLVDHASAKDGTCWPSLTRIAEMTGCSRNTVVRAIDHLEEDGLITVDRAVGRSHRFKVNPQQDPTQNGTPPTVGRGVTHSGTGTRPATGHEPPNEPPREPPTSGPPKRARERDLLFEAVVEATGLSLDALTKSARGAANRATKELREVGASPELVRRAAKQYVKEYPDAALTPTALAKHFPKLVPKLRDYRQSKEPPPLPTLPEGTAMPDDFPRTWRRK